MVYYCLYFEFFVNKSDNPENAKLDQFINTGCMLRRLKFAHNNILQSKGKNVLKMHIDLVEASRHHTHKSFYKVMTNDILFFSPNLSCPLAGTSNYLSEDLFRC